MRMDSCDALQLLHDFAIAPDLIYIDACHHFEGAYRDIATAVRLFPRAHIVGDDWDYEGVRKAAQTVARENGLELFVQSHKCWTYSKSVVAPAIQAKAVRERKEAAASSRLEEEAKKLRSMSFADKLKLIRKKS